MKLMKGAGHIHPQYLLAESVLRGVAYHYGNMPSVLAKTLEEYFQAGKIRYLVCTSTLLLGVNLPAKNIFMYQPTKGNNQPIGTADFWNLAGRAGRLKKDFQGNVFLVDYESWESKPLTAQMPRSVQSALQKAVTINKLELIEYSRDENQYAGPQDTSFIESAYVKLFLEFKANSLETAIRRVSPDISKEDYSSLEDAISFHIEKIVLPVEIIAKNRLISPLRQQALYNYFMKKNCFRVY